MNISFTDDDVTKLENSFLSNIHELVSVTNIMFNQSVPTKEELCSSYNFLFDIIKQCATKDEILEKVIAEIQIQNTH